MGVRALFRLRRAELPTVHELATSGAPADSDCEFVRNGQSSILCQFIGRSVLDAGGFRRYKIRKISNLRPSDCRVDEAELVLETFPGAPKGATRFLT